jgi:hypothetical protein
LADGEFIFWFHSFDALHENRASVHVGKGSQDDVNDAKVWLEPRVEIGKPGRTLKKHELNRAIKVIQQNQQFLLEQWHVYRGPAQ